MGITSDEEQTQAFIEQLILVIRAVANEPAPPENTNMADIRREAIKIIHGFDHPLIIQ